MGAEAAPPPHGRDDAGAPVAFHGTVEVDYSQFFLHDRAYRPTVTMATLAGLVTVRPGELIVVTGSQYGPVGCVITVSGRDPGADLDGYEDVEEVSFVSPTGVLSLVEWGTETPRVPAIELPAGPGAYRMRYHARNMDRAAEAADEVVDEYLLQIWPAAERPRTRPKVRSACARYWAELGDVRAEAAMPVPDGVGGNPVEPGRADVTESLPAAVTSTFWSHLLMRPGDHVRSRRAWLVFRPDGNLVVCDEDARVRWASGTAGRGARATFQIDGNLVVHNGDGGTEWTSDTHGYDGNFLAVQDDGNIVIYRADGNALWATGTNH